MRKLKMSLLALLTLCVVQVRADEGMWLLQMMKEQHLAEVMQKAGLELSADELYHPNKVSLKDAVGIFANGCTGEIISPEGLILTNHHCGYASIQKLSTVENDYLTDGFWARNRSEELPVDGLTFVFIDRIEDVTSVIESKIAAGEFTEAQAFNRDLLSGVASELLNKSKLKGKKGISVQLLPFFAGNKYYLIYKKTYTDIRMVAAPPSAIGKFGGDTDNWSWPRHTGDFSMFRVYADAQGEPEAYNEKNVPLQTKKHLAISLKGVEEGDYAMIMGFPGSTSRYLTALEVVERMEAINNPRIAVRGVRLAELKKAMDASDKTRIQYSNKYASSSNYWKNSIGMNKAIKDNDVLGDKKKQEQAFEAFAQKQGKEAYRGVIDQLNALIQKEQPILYQMTALTETFFAGLEFSSPSFQFSDLLSAVEKGDTKEVESIKKTLRILYENIHNKDYDHEVDLKVAKRLFPLYRSLVKENELPSTYAYIDEHFAGDSDAFVEEMYANSIMASKENLEKFLANPSQEAVDKDLSSLHTTAVTAKYIELSKAMEEFEDEKNQLHKTYVRGLAEMKQPQPSYPDANFSIRLTYGHVKSYIPRDGVFYKYYTTTQGILEKEDPTTREFNVPAKLKELIQNQDYGRYALPNGDMPVCFLTTNDITGGNSGSPVLNSRGELIGAAFDGNWESLSGDLNFDDDLQRCINVDIRYILFIIEKLGNASYLIDEMTIVE